MLQNAKQQYFNSLSSSSIKTFWKTVKLLSKKEVSIPTLNADDGITAVTDEKKSSMLNYYFSRCWNRSQPPRSEYSMNDNKKVGDSSDLLCSADETMKLIHVLDVGKANGR